MNIVRKARGTQIPQRVPRIFLSHNSCDAAARDAIISDLQDINTGIDCVVSYFENPDDDIDENQLRNELLRNRALIIYVTLKMLHSITQKKFLVEYRIAQEINIPILPILNDNSKELFEIFNKKINTSLLY